MFQKEGSKRCGYLLGLGFLWFYWFDVILFPGSNFYAAFTGRIVTIGACITALLLCLAIARRLKPRLLPLPFYAVAAVALSGGTVVSFFGESYFSLTRAASFFGSGAFGFGNGACLFMFLQLVAPKGLKDIRFVIAYSMAVGLLLNFACIPLMQISPVVFGCIESAFAISSIPLFVWLRLQTARLPKKPDLIGKDPLKVSLLRVSSTMVLFGAMVGFGLRSFKEQYTTLFGVGMVALSAFALVALERWLKTRFKVADILQCGKLCIVVAALSLLSQLIFNDRMVLSVPALFVSYVVFFAVMLIFYATIAHYQTQYDASLMFSLALISDGLGVALGVVLHIVTVSVDSEIRTTALFFAISFFMVAGVFFFNKQTLFPVDKSFGRIPDAKGEQVRCAQIAEEHGLTPRQREIMQMLARGERVNYIAEKLVLSPGTVRGHVNQIYRKLNVHSSAELMALVREEAIEHAEQI